MAYTKYHDDWQNTPSTATPIDAPALEHIEAGIAAAHALIPGGSTTPTYTLNVKDFGAKGDWNGTSGTDDSVAFKACISAALATRSSGTAPVRCEVIIPPGQYRLTQNDSLMTPSDGNNNGVYGLMIRGFGKDVTTLVFQPTTVSSTDPYVGNLFSAYKRARYFVIRDMTIESQNAAACCFYFFCDGVGSNMNQGNRFINLNFRGNWKRVFGFDGDTDANLNSEMFFDGISGQTATYSDAFFKVGGISGVFNQQNQFLDYWFYNSFFILGGGTLFDFTKGGSAHFVGGSWSASGPTAPAMTFVKLGQNFNNTSASNFSFHGIRFEPKASNHRVLDDQIGQGAITFENCIDSSSLQNTASIDYPLRRHVGGSPWGYGVQTTVSYKNCALAGYDSYEGPTVQRGTITYEGCYFFRGNNGELAVPAQSAGAQAVYRWTSGVGRYSFRDNWNAPNASNNP